MSLALLTLGLLCARPGYADYPGGGSGGGYPGGPGGHYVPSYNGGTVKTVNSDGTTSSVDYWSKTDNTGNPAWGAPFFFPQFSPPVTITYKEPIITTLTWQPDPSNPNAPPPPLVLVEQDSTFMTYLSEGVEGFVSTGLGNSGDAGGAAPAKKYTLKSDPGSSFVITPPCEPLLSLTSSLTSGYSGGNLTYSATAVPCTNLMDVEALRVDATDPHNAKIWFHTIPDDAVVQTATFTAPAPQSGGSSASQTQSSVSGEFSFTFDEGQLPRGVSTFSLQWTAASPFTAITGGGMVYVDANTTYNSAKGSSPTGAWMTLGDGTSPEAGGMRGVVVRVPLDTHDCTEGYTKFAYSLPVVPESKTIHVLGSQANIATHDLDPNPSNIAGWGENHYYQDDFGKYGNAPMNDETMATLPAQSVWFKSKSLTSDLYFAPGHNLVGAAFCTILSFDYDQSATPVIPYIIDYPTVWVPIN